MSTTPILTTRNATLPDFVEVDPWRPGRPARTFPTAVSPDFGVPLQVLLRCVDPACRPLPE